MYNRLGTIPACDGRTDILPRHSSRYAYTLRGKNGLKLLKQSYDTRLLKPYQQCCSGGKHNNNRSKLCVDCPLCGWADIITLRDMPPSFSSPSLPLKSNTNENLGKREEPEGNNRHFTFYSPNSGFDEAVGCVLVPSYSRLWLWPLAGMQEQPHGWE